MTTKKDCETAAIQLGLSSTTATETSDPLAPSYCLFLDNSFLYFNIAFNSDTSCSDEYQCVCKIPCTKDGGCPGQLICGTDKYCREPCNGGGCDCSKGVPGFCKEGEGDCDSDHECEGDLMCGTNNCAWGQGDCCEKPRGNQSVITLTLVGELFSRDFIV